MDHETEEEAESFRALKRICREARCVTIEVLEDEHGEESWKVTARPHVEAETLHDAIDQIAKTF